MNMTRLFQNRTDAARQLARELEAYAGSGTIVLAIPRGGVPIGFEITRRLGAQWDLIIPRKLPVPWNPEAGFGAVTAEGSVVLNAKMVEPLGLEEEQIHAIAADVRREILRRQHEFRGDRPAPDLKDKTVIIVDDGIASGYTMLAAVKSARMHEPRQVIAAAPVSSASAAQLIRPSADKLITLIESHHLPFAVASFYLDWYDLDDEEVKEYLQRSLAAGPEASGEN